MNTQQVAFPGPCLIAHLADMALAQPRKPPKRLKLERVRSKPGGGVLSKSGRRRR